MKSQKNNIKLIQIYRGSLERKRVFFHVYIKLTSKNIRKTGQKHNQQTISNGYE